MVQTADYRRPALRFTVRNGLRRRTYPHILWKTADRHRAPTQPCTAPVFTVKRATGRSSMGEAVPPSAAAPASEQPSLSETEPASGADDDVVEELHTEERTGFGQAPRQPQVVGARRHVAARMIVRDKDA